MESKKEIGTLPEPDYCTQKYNEETCEGCPFMDFEMVSHPGGVFGASVERHYCQLGHWREDF